MAGPPVILGYHGVAEVDPRYDPVRLYVSPDKLGRHIRSLKRRGYRFLSMRDFAAELGPEGPPKGICALTFDDGTVDHATVLPELLAEHEVPGTVFVCPELLGEPYPWVDAAAGARFMTRPEFDAMAASEWIEVGAHTNRHTEVNAADFDTALGLMSECKDLLEGWIGEPVPSFCYPRCHYSEASPAAARAAGFASAVTCGPRGDWTPFELKRESLHTPDGPVTWAFKSRGLYYGTRDRAPFRLARSLTRGFRHRRERG